MNEMIKIRQKLGESVWEIDQRFKRLKKKLKYVMTIGHINHTERGGVNQCMVLIQTSLHKNT
jgi:hypothetical protein